MAANFPYRSLETNPFIRRSVRKITFPGLSPPRNPGNEVVTNITEIMDIEDRSSHRVYHILIPDP